MSDDARRAELEAAKKKSAEAAARRNAKIDAARVKDHKR